VPETIVNVADSGPYDLLILGTHSHHPWSHLFRGSVSENVRRLATCPVITVPPARDGDDVFVEAEVDAEAEAIPPGVWH
jgi:hypothetical protein